MKRLLSLLGMLIVALSSFAQTFTVGDLTYQVTSTTDKAVRVSDGKNTTGDVVVPETVTYNGVEYRVTAIGSSAFASNKDITSVSMPSVTSIGGSAFYNCSSLISAILPAVTSIGYYAFQKCSALVSLNMLAVTSIGGNAFSDCKNISSLRIGSVEQLFDINKVDYSPLLCTSQSVDLYLGDSETPATNIELPSSVTEIPNRAFIRTTITSVSAPAATSIGVNAFYHCTSLSSVNIPVATSIGDQAFSGCSSLASASFPAATSIGNSAFAGCESLEEVIMPKVETIGSSAFSGSYDSSISEYRYCKALKYVDLSSVKTIGGSAFNGCSGISSLRIGSVEQWCGVQLEGNYVFQASPLYESSQSVDLYIGDSESPATSVEVPSTVTEIPDYAFYKTTITSFSAPAATSIGHQAFCNCTSLTSASLPAATSIGYQAFYNCTSLTSVSLPIATTIGSSAFAGCESLEEAIMPKVETIGSSAFSYYQEYVNGSYVNHYCKALKYVDLSSVKTIGSEAFRGCSGITSLRIGSVEQWCGVQLPSSNASYASPLYQSSQSVDLYIGDSETPVTNLEIPSTVTEIPQYAFYRTTITSVSAPAATSIGSYAFYNCTSLISASLPTATSIGGSAFAGCTSLEGALLPKVETVGERAFGWYEYQYTENGITYNGYRYCTSLKHIDFPAATSIGSSAFSGCSSLTSANLPSATSIGSYAFSGCSSLTSANLPSATSIGSSAFSGCKSLPSASLPAATSIGSSAFYGCSKLKSLSIPKVETIGSYAFQYASSIDTLRIGSVEQYCSIEYGYTNINNSDYRYQFPFQDDFNNCIFIGDSDTPVTEITIPETSQKIADYAFIGTGIHTVHFEGTNPPALAYTRSFPEWTMLAVPEEAYETYLAADVYNTIPLRITVDGHLNQDVEATAANGTSNLLEKIGEDEVKYVVNLKVSGTINSYDMLIIRNQMTSLRNLDLTDASIVDCDYIYSNKDGSTYHSIKDNVTGDWLINVMNVKLPANTKTIGSRAFYNNTRLQTVNIPDGVTSIGSEAFRSCNRIKELTLPQSVTSFGSNAFYYCTGLREVVIPDDVTSIGSSAFRYCIDLKKVTIPANVTSIGSSAFDENTLELHINDLESWLNIQMGSSNTFSNVAKLYIGDSLESTEDLIIPEGTPQIKNYAFAGFKCLKSVTFPTEMITIGSSAFYNCSGITDVNFSDNISSIGSYAFSGCSGLKTVKLPEKLTTINSYAFQSCSNLETIAFADNVTSIGEYAFSGCSKLTKLELPAYLKTISRYAFQSCSNLTEVVIPASLTSIADYAFSGCSKLNTVIATTVEPIRINQNTFSTYKTATLYSPKTSYYKYYWNTQYNQFLSRKEYDKEFAKVFGYKYFYLNGQNGDNSEDFVISDETGPIQGVDDKAPDADFYEGAGLVVGGEQVQNLGDIHLHHNGNNGASIIAKQSGKVHIDNLYIDIKTQKNRWYFFCFPFDVNTEDATFDGSHVWYLYDGETRAQNGNGGWKKTAVDGVMKAGNGYIFQGAQNGTLTIHVSDLTIDTSDSKTNMITYASDNKNDASWNLIGNPSVAYYDMDDLGYDAPITLYNNETGNYEAVRPGDDQYEFYPFQAFFVQKPEGVDALNFEADKKETKNMADKKKPAASGAKAKVKANSMRKVINLEIVAANETNDSVAAPTDRTRIVVNPMKTTAYEPECDAAKFIADNMPQIYSLDNDGSKYAINERPVEDGIIALAVKADKEGIYTISATRLDCAAKLRDLEAETEVDLAEGGYTFMAEAKTYTNRFQLVLSNVVTAITTPEEAQAAINVEAGAINITNSNANVKVYSVGGSLVASQKGAGTISVPAGTYVVNVNGQSIKINVNINK